MGMMKLAKKGAPGAPTQRFDVATQKVVDLGPKVPKGLPKKKTKGGAVRVGGVMLDPIEPFGSGPSIVPMTSTFTDETSMASFTVGGGFPGLPGGGGNGSIGGRLADLAEDYIRSKLIPGGSGASDQVPGFTGGGGSQPCPNGTWAVGGQCLDLIPGGNVSGGGMRLTFGEAVMGRYGAGLVPAKRSQTVHLCPRGAVLGNDGICYNRKDLRKADRMWVPGRKPLLTGGDLNAIARAASAATKMKTQQKRLQRLGLLPKPNAGRRPSRPRHMHSGHPITVIDT